MASISFVAQLTVAYEVAVWVEHNLPLPEPPSISQDTLVITGAGSGVFVGIGVLVEVGTAVFVAVAMGVFVGLGVCVGVFTGVTVPVGVFVGVGDWVGVFVGRGVLVWVGVGVGRGKPTVRFPPPAVTIEQTEVDSDVDGAGHVIDCNVAYEPLATWVQVPDGLSLGAVVTMVPLAPTAEQTVPTVLSG